jgi:hypothetical protein
MVIFLFTNLNRCCIISPSFEEVTDGMREGGIKMAANERFPVSKMALSQEVKIMISFERVNRGIEGYLEMRRKDSARLGMPHVAVNVIALIRNVCLLIDSKNISSSQRRKLISFSQTVSKDDPAYSICLNGGKPLPSL